MAEIQKPCAASIALARKYPEQVVIAIARDLKGIPNPITLGWAMVASHEPPMLAFAVGTGRYSVDGIRRSKEFVVAFPSREMAKDALFYGTRSGRDLEKIKACGTVTDPCRKIGGVIFTNAVANFECRLAGEIPAGDHVIFTGEVLQAWVNSEKKERLFTIGPNYRMGWVKPELTVEYSPQMFAK
jgi:flavin reductase (DIM6/NTAB) family NADH-FMN oxidoreductase RutF